MANSHSNFALTANLQKQGLSSSGARQVLAAQIVTDQKDRDLLAKMLGAGSTETSKPVAKYNLFNAWPTR